MRAEEMLALSQAAQDAVHWRAFCTAVIADLQASAVHVPAANETDAVRPDGSTLYRQRIPQLAQRMQDVLASSLDNVGHHASRTALLPLSHLGSTQFRLQAGMLEASGSYLSCFSCLRFYIT